MYKPQDIIIGDWLLYKGMPHCVVGIMDEHLTLKNPRENYCCGMPTFALYKDVKPIPISSDYLTIFGFKQADGEHDWLEGNVWKITFDDKELKEREADDFMFSWTENEYGERSYKAIFRGYGDNPCFRFDAVSDIQHFFYQESRCPMPLKLKIKSQVVACIQE